MTRRELVAGAGAVTLARNTLAETATVRTIIGKTAAELTPLVCDALAEGYAFASLSLYGPEGAPLYAALMIRDATPPAQRHWLVLTAAELEKLLAEQAKDGYGPAIIAAVGSAASPRFALVCAPQELLALFRLNLKSGRAATRERSRG